jgi:hypothetical protein
MTFACLDLIALDMGSSSAPTAHSGVKVVEPVEPGGAAGDSGKRKASEEDASGESIEVTVAEPPLVGDLNGGTPRATSEGGRSRKSSKDRKGRKDSRKGELFALLMLF